MMICKLNSRLQDKRSFKNLTKIQEDITKEGLNQQSLDMGMMETDLRKIDTAEKHIKRIGLEFDFVMIDELFYESLVLLADHLCLPLEYMIGVKHTHSKVLQYIVCVLIQLK